MHEVEAVPGVSLITFKHPQTSTGRHGIEKNELSSYLGAQNFQHRWMPEDLMYKIYPAGCACRVFLVINPSRGLFFTDQAIGPVVSAKPNI